MRSVAQLKTWIAKELNQFEGNNNVEYVLHYIRRKTDHPLYTKDPDLVAEWTTFLKTIDCNKILASK